jgi:hypothetical protein
MHRTAILAALALLGAASTPALAYPSLDPVTGAPNYALASVDAFSDETPPSETKAVNLPSGRDYAIYAHGYGGGDVYLQNPQGQRMPQVPVDDSGSNFGSFRTNFAGTFFLGAEARPLPDGSPGYASGELHADCRDDAKTRCAIGFAQAVGGWIMSTADRDWYGITLVRGQNYRFTLTARYAHGTLNVRDARGRLLKSHVAPVDGQAFVDLKAPANGRYFVAVSLVNRGDTLLYTLAAQRR